jgi:hypothetical protein
LWKREKEKESAIKYIANNDKIYEKIKGIVLDILQKMSFLPIEDDILIVHSPDINTLGISYEERKTIFYINNPFFQDVDVIPSDMVEYAFSRFHL